MKRSGLGRGLAALIPQGEPVARSVIPSSTISEVAVTDIAPNPRQPRDFMEPEALADLADSIRTHGLIQPLVLTQAPDGSAVPYYVVAGERRWRAAQLAGLPTLPAIIKEVTPQGMLELALVENLQRADLNPLEEAAAYQALVEEFGLTQEVVAARVGKSRVAVTNALRLLRLPVKVKESVISGEIREGHARALLGLPSDADMEQALETVVNRDLSVRQTEELVRRLTREAASQVDDQDVEEQDGPETRALETGLREALGTKVHLFRSRRGGRIVIHFYSEEELTTIYDAIVTRSDL
jgi:ParB family chromosome partitioning protein